MCILIIVIIIDIDFTTYETEFIRKGSKRMRKYSRQREVIKEFLKDRTDHPTADTIYTGVRQEIPNISLGTVYRNLMLLSEEGEIARLTVGDGTVHFDPNTTEHTHFVCTHCGCVQDLSIPNTEGLNQAAGAHFSGKITGHRLIFTGLCENCLAEKIDQNCRRA